MSKPIRVPQQRKHKIAMAELQEFLGCPREDWGDYPLPHYDEEDICRCPDHVAMRTEKQRRREQRRIINSTNCGAPD